MDIFTILVLLFACLGILIVSAGIKVVPQSMVYVIERFGKYDKTLKAGLNFIIPFLQHIAHRVDILERQLPTSKLKVITMDNVEIGLEISVFYRVVEAEKSVYRIKDLDEGVKVLSASIIRAACGELEFDEVQSKRETLNNKIKNDVSEGTAAWGIEVTRTEVLDVVVDEITKKGMQRQLDAERERRALVLKAEGEREALQLEADAKLYQVQKESEALRVEADANAYATKVIADAIKENGHEAIDFEIMKRKIDAIESLSGSQNSKLLILPTDVTSTLGGLETLREFMVNRKDE